MSNFKKMELDASIQKALEELGFIEPTPIQIKVIPRILDNKRDIIALAQTGTGKTAAFGLPLIELADTTFNAVQALILSPTRELAVQISRDLESYSRYKKDIKVVAVYGGAPIDKQISTLRKGVQIAVGTPGRMRDLIERKALKVDHIRWLVLDEADEMLQMGFKDDLDAILETTPENKQTLLFSATMPKGVYRIATEYMNGPEEIAVGTKNAGAENVSHEYYMTHARHRYEVLKRIADMNPDIYGIVFCRTRQETKEVAEKFMSDGYNADALHGDLSQAQRDHVMNRFRKRQLQMLVATDVAARGLDVNDLTHVINYNLPDDLEVYIHRSGRTGRAGKSGLSISIVHGRENWKIRDLEKLLKKEFKYARIPDGKEICKKQLFNLINKMEMVQTNDEQIGEFLPEIFKKLDWMTKEDLIKNFVALEFNRFLDYYKNAPDLNIEAEHKKRNVKDKTDSYGNRGRDNQGRQERNSVQSRGRSKEYARFHINMGSKNDLNPTTLIGLVLDTTNDRQIRFGKIDIMKGFSFFEVEKEYAQIVERSFHKKVRRNQQLVKVELSKEKKGM
ncbi:DEAD/DEAH box helicase [Bacteroidota bacterium]